MKVILQLDLSDRIGSRCDEASVNCANNTNSFISEERARQNMTDEQFEKWEEHVYVANMLALDSFRLAVADGTFKPDDIVVLYTDKKNSEPRKWSINKYGVLIDENGEPDPLPDLGARLAEKILTLAAARYKKERTPAASADRVAIPKRVLVKQTLPPTKFKEKAK